ncbi:phosphopantetheine-binding protein [Persicobacter psychrovividus]|uniref:Acyl carrier protein n=1 Tax=Persicobacter psychrovividus TaxID=387638 RepID=A0ABN6LG40_9BACT|nr:acyl carrier protein [Persicobacter psychrovividus]
MDTFKIKLKEQLIEALNLEDMTPKEIEDDAPLFGDGLGLDSIDALELIVLLEKEYDIKLADPEKSRAVFASVNTLASFITEEQGQ